MNLSNSLLAFSILPSPVSYPNKGKRIPHFLFPCFSSKLPCQIILLGFEALDLVCYFLHSFLVDTLSFLGEHTPYFSMFCNVNSYYSNLSPLNYSLLPCRLFFPLYYLPNFYVPHGSPPSLTLFL